MLCSKIQHETSEFYFFRGPHYLSMMYPYRYQMKKTRVEEKQRNPALSTVIESMDEEINELMTLHSQI